MWACYDNYNKQKGNKVSKKEYIWICINIILSCIGIIVFSTSIIVFCIIGIIYILLSSEILLCVQIVLTGILGIIIIGLLLLSTYILYKTIHISHINRINKKEGKNE